MRITMRESFSGVPAESLEGKPAKIGNNTFRYKVKGGATIVRLHKTDIMTLLPDGRIMLDSGGWKTTTTKDRLSSLLPGPYRIRSDKGIWYVSNGADSVAFYDGMILPDAFSATDSSNVKRIREQRALAKAINRFVRDTFPIDAPLLMPNNGDCWLCIKQQEQPRDRSTGGMGAAREQGQSEQAGQDYEHLRLHIEEGYLHGSLIVNAMLWAGYTDQSIGYHFHMKGPHTSAKSAVRRYLRRKLGLAG